MTGKTLPSQKLEPLRLHFKSKQNVVVTTEDEDRFVTTSQEAALACRRAQDEKEWKQEFHDFLGYIHGWCNNHVDVVDRAYLGFGDEGMKVFVVTKGQKYRFEIDDLVADLALELTKEFSGCPADLMHLPDRPLEALTSFFSPAKALQLYGG